MCMHYNNALWISADINKVDLVNDPECPIQLKVRSPDGTPYIRMLWHSELIMRDGHGP